MPASAAIAAPLTIRPPAVENILLNRSRLRDEAAAGWGGLGS